MEISSFLMNLGGHRIKGYDLSEKVTKRLERTQLERTQLHTQQSLGHKELNQGNER
jgi:hypothetical protein